MIIVNSFQPLTIITKCSILDVAAVLDPALIYGGKSGKPFASEAELKKEIKSVWNICLNDLVRIRKAIKQFVQRMKAIEDLQER